MEVFDFRVTVVSMFRQVITSKEQLSQPQSDHLGSAEAFILLRRLTLYCKTFVNYITVCCSENINAFCSRNYLFCHDQSCIRPDTTNIDFTLLYMEIFKLKPCLYPRLIPAQEQPAFFFLHSSGC